ncbi:MAG: hypothetical protein JWO41_897 [Candidatus Saccharibacteria bacterium]|nr:hypothetical protein [Candidatus Saccharibacteria bacterium]
MGIFKEQPHTEPEALQFEAQMVLPPNAVPETLEDYATAVDIIRQPISDEARFAHFYSYWSDNASPDLPLPTKSESVLIGRMRDGGQEGRKLEAALVREIMAAVIGDTILPANVFVPRQPATAWIKGEGMVMTQERPVPQLAVQLSTSITAELRKKPVMRTVSSILIATLVGTPVAMIYTHSSHNYSKDTSPTLANGVDDSR